MIDFHENAMEKSSNDAIHTFTSVWEAFLSFENMSMRKRDEKLDAFIRRWKENMRMAKSAGCDYSDTILACKLLQKANLGKNDARNVADSIDFCPSEMLNTLFFTLESYSVAETERDESVKSESEQSHARRIKEEFPEDALGLSKPPVQSEEELLLRMELKEEVLESGQHTFFDFSNAVDDDLPDDSIVEEISKEQEIVRKRRKNSKGGSRMSTNGGQRFYCNACPLSFTQAISLKKHFMRKHTDERPFKCTQCSYSAVRRNELTKHYRRHTGEKPYKCPSCKKAFGEKKSMRYHFERAHASEPSYTCPICNLWTAESRKMTLHMKTHAEKVPLTCSLCEKSFSLKKILRRHMLVKHGQELVEEEDNLENDGDMNEDAENEKYKSKPLKEELEENPAKNDAKALAESSDKSVGESEGKKTGKKPKETKKAEKLQCEHCGKEFGRSGALKVHYRKCSNLDENERNTKGSKYECKKVKFPCEVCNKTIVGESSYINHLSLHSSERNFICDVCPATFTSAYHLNFHKYRHKKGKWRQCDSCDKSFSQTGDLKRHIMRMHTDERPFQCSHCTYSTVDKSHLERHIRSHTGETPFKCNLCGKMYKDRKSVKRHINAHHGFCDEKYIGKIPTLPEKNDEA